MDDEAQRQFRTLTLLAAVCEQALLELEPLNERQLLDVIKQTRANAIAVAQRRFAAALDIGDVA